MRDTVTAAAIPAPRWDRARRYEDAASRAGRLGFFELWSYAGQDNDSVAVKMHRPTTVTAAGFPSTSTAPFVTVTAQRDGQAGDVFVRSEAKTFLTLEQARRLRADLDAAIGEAEGK